MMGLKCKLLGTENNCSYPCYWTDFVEGSDEGGCFLKNEYSHPEFNLTYCPGSRAKLAEVCTDFNTAADCTSNPNCTYAEDDSTCSASFLNNMTFADASDWQYKVVQLDLSEVGCCKFTDFSETVLRYCKEKDDGTCSPSVYCMWDEDPLFADTRQCTVKWLREIQVLFGKKSEYYKVFEKTHKKCGKVSDEDSCWNLSKVKLDWDKIVAYTIMLQSQDDVLPMKECKST